MEWYESRKNVRMVHGETKAYIVNISPKYRITMDVHATKVLSLFIDKEHAQRLEDYVLVST